MFEYLHFYLASLIYRLLKSVKTNSTMFTYTTVAIMPKLPWVDNHFHPLDVNYPSTPLIWIPQRTTSCPKHTCKWVHCSLPAILVPPICDDSSIFIYPKHLLLLKRCMYYFKCLYTPKTGDYFLFIIRSYKHNHVNESTVEESTWWCSTDRKTMFWIMYVYNHWNHDLVEHIHVRCTFILKYS